MSAGGIRSRLKRLGLLDENGVVVEPAPPFVDGWSIEIRSNRVLDQSLVERLSLMLRGAVKVDKCQL